MSAPRLFLSGLLAAAALAPKPADACSLMAPPALAGSLPEQGASDVPLDVSPILVGNVASIDVLAEDGSAVPFDVDEHTQGVVIRFAAPLAPQTAYTVLVGSDFGEPGTLSFTTGADLADDGAPVPAAPDVSLTGLSAQSTNTWSFYCGEPLDYLCASASVPDGHALVVGARVATDAIGSMLVLPEMAGTLVFGSSFYSEPAPASPSTLMLSDWDASRCVSVRLRDLAGRVGPERTMCAGDFPVHAVEHLSTVDCSPRGLTYDVGLPDVIVEPPAEDPPIDSVFDEVPPPTGEQPTDGDGGVNDETGGAGGSAGDDAVSGSRLRGVDGSGSGDPGGCAVVTAAAPGASRGAAWWLMGAVLLLRRRWRP